MPRYCCFLLLLVAALPIWLGPGAGGDHLAAAGPPGTAVAGAPVPTAPATDPVEDPFPIARVRVAEAALTGLLDRFAPGEVVRLPRHEFEERVRTAGREVAAGRTGPRLAEAKYTATLDGEDLVGDAVWVITNPHPGPGVLTLDPLRVAPRDPAWEGGRKAVVGVFTRGPQAETGVWVPAPGTNVLKTKWSVAGTTAGGERRFEVRVPPAPAAVLDLTLPADGVPVVASPDVLLTGPFPVATAPSRRLWRFRFGGRATLDFTVRNPGDAEVTGVVLATLAARYQLEPGQVACSFEYDFRPTRGTVGEWVFGLPRGVRVTEVVVNNRAGWQADPEAGTLRVNLRQPGTGGKVLVTAVAPLPPVGKPAALPMIRPVGAEIGTEQIEIRIHPDLVVTGWNPGDYRLTDAAAGTGRDRVLVLTGSLTPPRTDRAFRRPPAVGLVDSDIQFSTREQLDWRVVRGRVALTARMEVRVRRGPLFGITLDTPPGFTLDRVTTTPETATDVADRSGGPDPGARVEFRRPVGDGQAVQLTLELRGPVLGGDGPTRFPFPVVTPVGADEREGVLVVTPGPGWHVTPRPIPGATPPSSPSLPGGSSKPGPSGSRYPYRGVPPGGELVVSPAPPDFTTAAVTRLGYTGNGIRAETRVTVDVAGGVLPSLVIYEPGPERRERAWKVADGVTTISSATPVGFGRFTGTLPLLARPWSAYAPVVAARASAGAEVGRFWLIRFAAPATGTVVLETTAEVGGAPTRDEARRRAGEWIAGRHEFFRVIGARQATSRVEGGPILAPAPAPAAGGRASRPWAFDGLCLVTACDGQKAETVFGGTLSAAADTTLPVRLPEGAEVTAVCVGGHWLTAVPGLSVGADGVPAVHLPVPTDAAPLRFEIRYRLAGSRGRVVRAVSSPLPGLPGPPGPIARWWVFADDTSPVWPRGFSGGDEAGALPALLGPPVVGQAMTGGPGPVVYTVPARAVDLAGVGLAAVLTVLGWAGLRRRSRRAGLGLIAVVAAGGVAVLVGPDGWHPALLPPLLVSALALAVIVGRGRLLNLHPARPGPVTTAVLVLALTALAVGRAEPPPPAAVFVVSGNGDSPDTAAVYVPRVLLDRIDAAGRRSTPGPVLAGAAYDGRVEDGLARFTARFTVEVFADDPVTLPLPFTGIRLEGAAIDGHPTDPLAPRPDVYTVPVRGRGPHEVVVRFAAPVETTGPEREVQFGVPVAADCRLTFAAPGESRHVAAPGRFGAQSLTTTPAGVRLTAALGGVKTVQVRWRQGPAGDAAVTAREGCVWDVSEAAAALTACYQLQVDAGAATAFRFDLPADLEPVRVVLRALDPRQETAALGPWVVGDAADGYRPLRVELTRPVTGRVLLTLECVPRGPLTRVPTLRFPRPVGMDRASGVYGLRATGVVVEGVGRVGVIDYAPDAFVRAFGEVPDLRLGMPGPLLAFSRQPGREAELRPTLRAPDPAPAVSQDVTWRVDPRRADGEGAIRFAAAAPLPLIEFTVPQVRLAEVRGPDVDRWSQSGGRVLVWFRKPVRAGVVHWVATVAPAHPGKLVPDAVPFELPVPKLVTPGTLATTLRVIPADGVTVDVKAGRDWEPAPETAPGERVFTSEGVPKPFRLDVHPAKPGPVREPDSGDGNRAAAPGPSPVRSAPAGVGLAASPPAPVQAAAAPHPPPPFPVVPVAGWCLAVLVLAGLFVVVPGRTWPEQIGLVVGLAGFVLTGGVVVGVAALAAARAVWLLSRLAGPTPAARAS